jgi:uncharacterized protein (DUF2461 family)
MILQIKFWLIDHRELKTQSVRKAEDTTQYKLNLLFVLIKKNIISHKNISLFKISRLLSFAANKTIYNHPK